MFHVPEKFRVRKGFTGSDPSNGNNGFFVLQRKLNVLRVIASDEMGWEHVSVSLPTRCPTWEEMCYVKDLFWDDDDCVIQYHPPRSDYVNNHPYCLHLWKPVGIDLPRPNPIFVGHAGMSPAEAKQLAERIQCNR